MAFDHFMYSKVYSLSYDSNVSTFRGGGGGGSGRRRRCPGWL